MAEPQLRPVWAELDLDAVRHNTLLLCRAVAPSSLCAVVKADAYGHGATAVARAALDGGASWLAVAMAEEGTQLREAGIGAPVLILSEPRPDAMREAVASDLRITAYTLAGARAAAEAAEARGSRQPLPVHVKVDTGMHRVGARPEDVLEVATAVSLYPSLRLEGFWTHLAVAEDPDDMFSSEQLSRFEAARRRLADAGLSPSMVHAANSAAAIAHPSSRYDMVRCGIAVYGYAPSQAVASRLESSGVGLLRPALSLRARVAHVQELRKGERVSYGRRYELSEDSVIATVPIGYADGLPRRLFEQGGEVLVGGRRCPLAGTVTMDQVMVDCGPRARVGVGDEVVLIGRQGREEIDADDWARRLGTISYEVLCGIGPRVPRLATS